MGSGGADRSVGSGWLRSVGSLSGRIGDGVGSVDGRLGVVSVRFPQGRTSGLCVSPGVRPFSSKNASVKIEREKRQVPDARLPGSYSYRD